jgi:hypothetical protein
MGMRSDCKDLTSYLGGLCFLFTLDVFIPFNPLSFCCVFCLTDAYSDYHSVCPQIICVMRSTHLKGMRFVDVKCANCLMLSGFVEYIEKVILSDQ